MKSAGNQQSVPHEGLVPQLGSVSGLSLLASSPDCVKILRPDGTLIFLNENGRCLLELDDLSGVMGTSWSLLWPETARSDIARALDCARAGEIGRFTGYCPTAKGTPKWWDVAISPVYNLEGSLACLLCISRDITQQKSTENALRTSERHFRALADNIAQFAWMADSSGYIFWYNQRWFDYTGATLDEMRGWGWRSVHHPSHIDRVVAKFSACLEKGSVWEDTFPLRGADGNYRWFLSRAMPILGDDGNVLLWCGTNTDVTDQRNANARLRQLARLIELSHEAISVRSRTKGILLWNRGCEELYGFSHPEAVGKDPHELLKTENPLDADALDHLVETEGTWSGELVRTAKDGRRVWVETRKQAIRLDDEAVILESDRDVTDRKRADDVRNLLVAELNHRVKNTLAIVQSLATQTARGASTVDEFICKFSGRIHSLSVAHNVLTDTNWSMAKIRDLVRTQIETIAGDLGRVQLEGPDLALTPQTALQLTLILHELATNAVKYGALATPSGHIIVTWEQEGQNGDELKLVWRERGGPPVVAPAMRGFGLTLIERSSRLPQIKASLEFEEEGVICTLKGQIEREPQLEGKYFDPAQKLPLARWTTPSPQTSK